MITSCFMIDITVFLWAIAAVECPRFGRYSKEVRRSQINQRITAIVHCVFSSKSWLQPVELHHQDWTRIPICLPMQSHFHYNNQIFPLVRERFPKTNLAVHLSPIDIFLHVKTSFLSPIFAFKTNFVFFFFGGLDTNLPFSIFLFSCLNLFL